MSLAHEKYVHEHVHNHCHHSSYRYYYLPLSVVPQKMLEYFDNKGVWSVTEDGTMHGILSQNVAFGRIWRINGAQS
jgi:hypothetical protein